MRTAALVAVSALLGGLIGALVIYGVIEGVIQSPGRHGASTRNPAGVARAPGGGSALTSASRLVAAGKLREAQEQYLTVLLADPTSRPAMQGLVRVAGLISGGNPQALRRRAADYRGAIAKGRETDEHYTAAAMDLLARASLQAARDLQSAARRKEPPRVRSPRAVQPAPVRVQEVSRPQVKARPTSPPRTRPSTGPAAPAPAAPAPAPTPTTAPPSVQRRAVVGQLYTWYSSGRYYFRVKLDGPFYGAYGMCDGVRTFMGDYAYVVEWNSSVYIDSGCASGGGASGYSGSRAVAFWSTVTDMWSKFRGAAR